MYCLTFIYGKLNSIRILNFETAFSLSACDCFEGKYELIGLYGMDECSAECGEGRRRNVIIVEFKIQN